VIHNGWILLFWGLGAGAPHPPKNTDCHQTPYYPSQAAPAETDLL